MGQVRRSIVLDVRFGEGGRELAVFNVYMNDSGSLWNDLTFMYHELNDCI